MANPMVSLFIRENTIKMDDDWRTSIHGTPHMSICHDGVMSPMEIQSLIPTERGRSVEGTCAGGGGVQRRDCRLGMEIEHEARISW